VPPTYIFAHGFMYFGSRTRDCVVLALVHSLTETLVHGATRAARPTKRLRFRLSEQLSESDAERWRSQGGRRGRRCVAGQQIIAGGGGGALS
jgi:hypothetical protein